MIIFIYGEDTYQSFQKIKLFKKKFIREIDSIGGSISVLNGVTTTVQEISQKNNAQSLFSTDNKRMIIINDIFLNNNIFEELVEYLKKSKAQESKNILIFKDCNIKKNNKGQIVKLNVSGYDSVLNKKASKLFTFLSNSKYTYEVKPFSNIQVSQWIKDRVLVLGGKITDNAVQALVSLVGNNLWILANEVDKLFYFNVNFNTKESNEITEKDVLGFVTGTFDEKIFELIDIIVSKNNTKAIGFIEEQYEAGLDEHYIFHMIVRQVKILLQIKQAVEDKQINILKMHPFVIKKGIAQAMKFTLPQLKTAFSDLLKIDFNVKIGKENMKTMISLFILKFSK